MILHSYWRSSAAFRVRIALNLKGLAAEQVNRDLRIGKHRSADYLALNPQGLVPALEIDGALLTQSLAIIEYLDETYPTPPLLPADPIGRARVRALAQMVACDIHPIANLRVLNYLRGEMGQASEQIDGWFNHWVSEGLAAIEARLTEPETGRFCHGDTPTLADICLVPQLVNGTRFGLDPAAYSRVQAICEETLRLPAFADAMPVNQPDAD